MRLESLSVSLGKIRLNPTGSGSVFTSGDIVIPLKSLGKNREKFTRTFIFNDKVRSKSKALSDRVALHFTGEYSFCFCFLL